MHTRNYNGSGQLALAVGLAMVMLGTGCTEEKKEVALKFSECPAAVQKTIIDHANGVQFAEVKKETKKDGRIIYEAKGKKTDGEKIEIKVGDDGHLTEFKSEESD